ncbi:Lrp/AsnC family transcriptional regulator [Microbacterium sp. RD1]|uniref:Lrp/AsnC family transcriptional regulator n=1 Tax=Microbacterium sp. RD1 TaxID=3457313 RepID=UPI003FA58D1C
MTGSIDPSPRTAAPNDLPRPWDDLDRRIIDLLAADARMTNAELAARAGVAPSTAHGRLRALVRAGVVSGFHAAVNQAAVGHGLQAMIGVMLRPAARQESISDFAGEMRRLPAVLQLFFVGGTEDFLLHVSVPDSSALRQFVVDNLSAHRNVASTRTSIIFEYHRNGVASSFG